MIKFKSTENMIRKHIGNVELSRKKEDFRSWKENNDVE